MAEKTYRLKDESTGFHDPATGLKIVRAGAVRLKGKLGRLTMQAIQSGRLVEVRTAPAEALPSAVATGKAQRKARPPAVETD